MGLLKPRKIEVDKAANEGYDPNVIPLPCDTFEHLITVCQEGLHVTPGIEDALAVMIAVNLSLQLGDVPLWGYFIGPPSAGKTTIAELVASAHPYCYSLSKMTGVFSGFRGPGGDASLLPKFQGRTVVLKDFTSILKLPGATQDTIFAELRELYDGSANVHYRNHLQYNYQGVRFAMIACVTDAIRAHTQTDLGERFFCVEIDSWWSDDGHFGRHSLSHDSLIGRAISNMLGSICDSDEATSGKFIPQKCHTFGLLETLHHTIESDPSYVATVAGEINGDQSFKQYVADIAQWVGFARANVQRDRSQGLIYRPRAEIGARLAKQLIKLAVTLCLVFRVTRPDDRVKRIVRKVALDTGISFQLEIMLAICHCTDEHGLTTDQLASILNISNTSVARHLSDMRELQIVSNHSVKTQSGRPTLNYRLTPELEGIAKRLGFR